MKSIRQFTGAALCVVGAAFAFLMVSGSAVGQPSTLAVIAQGEVTTNDVYVRSGPSMNYYPVRKLQAGDRVQIVAEREEWYQILPPTGTFSLIHEDYVDTVDGKAGVVNGDNVLVRAGSSLPEWSKQKYARQAKLSKGAHVAIVGKSPEGYMQIEPPVGVTVWIHRTLIHPLSDDLLQVEKQAGSPGRGGPESKERRYGAVRWRFHRGGSNWCGIERREWTKRCKCSSTCRPAYYQESQIVA